MTLSGFDCINPNLLISQELFNEGQYLSSNSYQSFFLNIEECETQYNYNFEFTSNTDTISFSMENDIYKTGSTEFIEYMGSNNIRTRLIPIGDLWITIIFDEIFIIKGKTHLNSVAQAVVAAVLGALESFAKKITELASKIFDWIYAAFTKLMNIILKPIMDSIRNWFAKIFDTLANILKPFISDVEKTLGRNGLSDSIAMIGTLIKVFILPLIVVTLIVTGLDVFDKIAEAATAEVGTVIEFTLSTIAKELILSFVLGAILSVGAGLSYVKLIQNGETPTQSRRELDKLFSTMQLYIDTIAIVLAGYDAIKKTHARALAIAFVGWILGVLANSVGGIFLPVLHGLQAIFNACALYLLLYDPVEVTIASVLTNIVTGIISIAGIVTGIIDLISDFTSGDAYKPNSFVNPFIPG